MNFPVSSNHRMCPLIPFLPHPSPSISICISCRHPKISQYLYLCSLHDVTLLCNTQLQKFFFFQLSVSFHFFFVNFGSPRTEESSASSEDGKKRARKPLRRSIKVFLEATFQIPTFSIQFWLCPSLLLIFYSPASFSLIPAFFHCSTFRRRENLCEKNENSFFAVGGVGRGISTAVLMKKNQLNVVKYLVLDFVDAVIALIFSSSFRKLILR